MIIKSGNGFLNLPLNLLRFMAEDGILLSRFVPDKNILGEMKG